VIIELGHFALILAFAIATVATLVGFGFWRTAGAITAFLRQAAVLQLLLVGAAFAALIEAFVTSDFSLALAYEHSHSLMPLVFKVTSVWGSHEGSMVLWISILVAFGAAVAVFGRRLPQDLLTLVLAMQALLVAAFTGFTLFTSNPFLRLDPAPFEGKDLNPILQDAGLALHPPLLYTGYVGFSICFSFAIAALISGRIDAAWARWVRPWALLSWCFLTLGIAMGSYWAYYELGWGGWWFWDPVENASFMPWLAGTALLHSALVMEKRNALKIWTVFLSIITFSLSLLGTFLVRSGVLT
jgi:cytochrome c-type biogenesis protein CcmF